MKTDRTSEDGKVYAWYYTGLSMHPTLKAGELLDVEPYVGKPVLRGDVVVFNPDGKEKFVIHRVSTVRDSKIITKGDNNGKTDPWTLSRNHIVGRVTHARDDRRRRKIAGGFSGSAQAQALRLIKGSTTLLKDILRPFYHQLAANGTLRKAISLDKRVKVIAVKKDGGTERKLLLGRRVIGTLKPRATQWQISQPFRLFVSEHLLPGQ